MQGAGKETGSDTGLEPPAWQQVASEEISQRLADADFPCLFARKAWRAGSIWFQFCERDRYVAAREALAAYTDMVKTVAIEERLYRPLCLVFRSEEGEQPMDQHAAAWQLLEWLHRYDPQAWPAKVPDETDDPAWSFCFNGVPLFVNISSAAHVQLKSRNLGRCLVLVVNPRENFDVVASAASPHGRALRARIRDRVECYNQAPAPASLGFHGEPGNREWMQYQLDEPGLEAPACCPFSTQRRRLR